MKTINSKTQKEFYKEKLLEYDLMPKELIDRARLVLFETDEIIIRQGEDLKYLYFLVEGSAGIKVFFPDGKQFMPGEFIAPCVLGEMELLDSKINALEVRSRKKSVAFLFPAESCREILLNDPVFLRKLCIIIRDKERRTLYALLDAQGYAADRRIKDYILKNMDRENIIVCRKTDISENLGISYRHVTRIFKELVKAGFLIKIDSKKYLVKTEGKPV